MAAAAGGAKCMFGVTIKNIDIIEPEIPIQQHWLPLSNLDLLLPPLQPSTFFCYKKPHNKKYSFNFMATILKNAMAKTLVPLYPLAGEMVQNAFGEPEIFCNNRGVDFIEAYADVDLDQIDLYNADHSIGKLVPPLSPQGLFSFQATELKCGGIAVGCTVDHRVTDGYSLQMLWKSWSESAQGKPFSRIPSFRRSLLFPLHSQHLHHHHHHSVKDLYMPLSALHLQHVVKSDDEPVSRIYCISAEELTKIQLMANDTAITITPQEKKISKFQAFTAFLWKTLELSRVHNSDDDKMISCILGVVVDGRSRLGSGDADKLKSLRAYYGNVISNTYGVKGCHELKEMPLNSVANEVHDFLAAATTKQHFLGLIDLVEAHRPEPLVSKMMAQNDGPSVMVSTGHEFPVSKQDFGWGPSSFSTNYCPVKGQIGYVGTMRSSAGIGDWIVYMNMQKQQLDFLENHAPQVFKPFTTDYLKMV